MLRSKSFVNCALYISGSVTNSGGDGFANHPIQDVKTNAEEHNGKNQTGKWIAHPPTLTKPELRVQYSHPPSQLGPEYNLHILESFAKHVAPSLGWKPNTEGPVLGYSS